MFTFVEAEIDTNNIIAFSTDGASVMVGEKNSIASRMASIKPDIIKIKCDCHSLHLCTRDAVQIIPKECLALISNIHNYVTSSSHRKRNWSNLQNYIKAAINDMKKLMIVQTCTTRWLSHYESIRLKLRRWTLLTIFFEKEAEENEKKNSQMNGDCSDKSAQAIFDALSNVIIKAYFTFLEEALSLIICVNKTLQAEKPILPEDQHVVIKLFVDCLNRYMDNDYVQNYVETSQLSNIDELNEDYFKEIEKVNIGKLTQKFIRDNITDDEEKMLLLETCQKFYIDFCSRMKQRFDFKNQRFNFLRCINPRNAMSMKFHEQEQPDLRDVFLAYKSIIEDKDIEIKNKVNEEWQSLPKHDFPAEIQEGLEKSLGDAELFYFKYV